MRIQAVTSELSYLAPESTVLRRFTAPGESVNTGTYRTYEMPIHDGRPVRDQFTLDRDGFAIVGHTSAVTDFTNREEVNEVYAAEVAEFVKFYTGADRASTLGWVLRRSAAPSENASQPQAASVHDDYSVARARGPRPTTPPASPTGPASAGRSSPACGASSARRRRTGPWPCATIRASSRAKGWTTACTSWTRSPTTCTRTCPRTLREPAVSNFTTTPGTSGGTSRT